MSTKPRRSKRYPKTKVDEMINEAKLEAVQEFMRVNSAGIDPSVRQRMASMVSGGYDYADTLHNVYLDYGYPSTLQFYNFWNMYRRFGVAKRVVEIYPSLGWMEEPTITKVDSDEPLENTELDSIIDRLRMWTKIRGGDIRQRVGRYGGLFMRVRDSKMPHEPLERGQLGPDALIQIRPLYESQLKVSTTEQNIQSDNYGMPTMYEYNASAVGNRQERGARDSFNIHPSRVIIFSEDADDGGIYGMSALESVYNSLMDLRKIIGAGGEGFYKNASQSVLFKLANGFSSKGNEEFLEKFNDEYDEFSRSPFRKGMWLPGLEADQLNASIPTPKEYFDAALNDIAAGSDTPANLLIGQQTGRLAGDQDMRGFLAQVQARKEGTQDEFTRDVIDWLMFYGFIPTQDYDISWPDALALSDSEKLDNAVKMAGVNQSMFNSGQRIPFGTSIIQQAAGHDPDEMPEPDELPDETLPEDEEDEF